MITDEMLRAAASEADQAILDSLPLLQECDHQFSPQFERKMKRVIRRGRHPGAYKFLRTAACFLVAVVLTGTTWLTVDAEARGAFFAWVRQQYETFVEYRFAGPTPDEEMTTDLLPHGCLMDLKKPMCSLREALLCGLIATAMVG